MNCIANEINNAVTMKDVVERYNIAYINRNNTIKCPFHNEKTASCKLYENSFYCFGCGKGGDIIKFVQLYFNVNFQQSLIRLNYDFGLGLKIGKKLTIREQKELELQNKRLQVYKAISEKVKEVKSNRYYNALSDYIELENDKREYAPKSIEELEENGFNDKYINALQHIDYVAFLLDMRDIERSI